MAAPIVDTALPKNVAANPRLSAWIDLTADGTVLIRTGKVELGQGILTAVALIAADELGVRPDRVVPEAARTDRSPNEGATSGSMSVVESGGAIRYVCRQVRRLMLEEAARLCGVPAEELAVDDGTVTHRGEAVTTYWKLAAIIDLGVDAGTVEPGPPRTEPAMDLDRVDLPDKVFGRARFIQDLVLPGMLHARVVRPAGPAAHLVSVDADAVRALPGVVLVHVEGDFLGVLARREEEAERAAAALRASASWTSDVSLPVQAELSEWLRAQETDDLVVGVTDRQPSFPEGVFRASYSKGFTAHASIAPSCGLAAWSDQGLTVWTHSQGVFGLRKAMAAVLDVPEGDIVVRHVEGAGCYGHNPADDAAFEAAFLARLVPGVPVRMLWDRGDEFGWDPFGPAMTADVQATVDSEGSITDWRYDVWSNGHTTRPGYGGSAVFLADHHRRGEAELPAAVDPPPIRAFGSGRNAVPGYRIARHEVTAHRLRTMPIRTSALRALGSFMNVFAIESFLDEIADARGIDPVRLRLQNLDDERGRAVIETVAERASWDAPLDGESMGKGIGYARYKGKSSYCAVIAHVEAAERVVVRKLFIVVDVGRIVSVDGVRNQIEGGALQALSWTVNEAVGFDERAITSVDWEEYPILTFADTPEIDCHVVPHPPSVPSLGAGEAAQGPVAAAIANAVFDAIGVRVRTLPLTPANIIAAFD